MAAEHRRVIAETPGHAQALAENLAKQQFVVESQRAAEWLLRKRRRRGDVTVTIMIRDHQQVGTPLTPPRAVPPSPWGPPTGPPGH